MRSFKNTNDDRHSDISILESEKGKYKEKSKGQGGWPRGEIWEYFQSEKLESAGHYRAKCYYCLEKWAKEEPCKLETHIGFECSRCLENIREY